MPHSKTKQFFHALLPNEDSGELQIKLGGAKKPDLLLKVDDSSKDILKAIQSIMQNTLNIKPTTWGGKDLHIANHLAEKLFNNLNLPFSFNDMVTELKNAGFQVSKKGHAAITSQDTLTLDFSEFHVSSSLKPGM